MKAITYSSVTGRRTRERSDATTVLLGAPLRVPAAFLRGRVAFLLTAQLRVPPKLCCLVADLSGNKNDNHGAR